MSTKDVTDLLDSVTNLVGTVIWPALVLFLVLRFRHQLIAAADELRSAIRTREFSMKAGPSGVELSAGARAASILLEEAESRTSDGAPRKVRAAVEDAVEAINWQPRNRGPSVPRVLWVDDRPENNRLERRAFEEIGIDVRLATSTDEALEILENEPVDIVISDMDRPPDARAGYTLLDELRAKGNSIPFVIYAGSSAPEHDAEARSRGAMGSTNRPSKLITLVTRALLAGA